MERIDYGVVSFIGDKFIKANLFEDSDECISCPLNGKCKSNIEITFKVKDPKIYEIGERIKIKVFTSKRLWFQFLLMGLPILLLLLGVILGGILFHNENGSALFGVLFFVISLVFAVIYLKKQNKILYKLEK